MKCVRLCRDVNNPHKPNRIYDHLQDDVADCLFATTHENWEYWRDLILSETGIELFPVEIDITPMSIECFQYKEVEYCEIKYKI